MEKTPILQGPHEFELSLEFLSLDGPNGLITENNPTGATSCNFIFIQDDFLTSRFLIRR